MGIDRVLSGVLHFWRDRFGSYIQAQKKKAKLGVSATQWRNLRWKVIKRDGRKCGLCKRYCVERTRRGPDLARDNDLTIDHVIPVSKGGETDLANLRVLCRKCNHALGIQAYAPTPKNTPFKEAFEDLHP